MEKVILLVNFGGLGDNLQFSTLPEEFKNQKNLDFYIHQSTYNNFRNKEIFSLVWEMNPYFKGVSNNEANAGHIHGYPGLDNMICDIEIMHGLECKNNTFKLYYEPKKSGSFNFIFDLTSISLKDYYTQNKEQLSKIVEEILEDYDTDIYFVEFINLKSKDYFPIINIPKAKKIEIKSIFEYCDVLSSCNNFVGLHSGGSHLATTYKNKFGFKVNLIESVHTNGWRMNGVNYIKIK
jgi:hypothetical protein